MKQMNKVRLTVFLLFAALIAGCASTPVVVNKEASTSAIRAAEEVGASKVPSASLYLQLAKEELENAKVLATKSNKEQSESMLSRAQADAELAVALSHGDADKKEAALALERVGKLRQDNQLPQKGSDR
jgi:Na+(H+)/acetate symporter ActP